MKGDYLDNAVAELRKKLRDCAGLRLIERDEILSVLEMVKGGKPAYKGLGATKSPQYFRYIRLNERSNESPDTSGPSPMQLDIGGRYSNRVISCNIPFYVAGMSMGSLKLPMKIALHLAANELAKCYGKILMINTGEGGALPWEIYGKEEHKSKLSVQEVARIYDYASRLLTAYNIKFESESQKRDFIENKLFERHYPLVVQVASGRFWKDPNYLKNADGIEIKIGQGAKIGHGGLLPGTKVDENIAEIRGIPVGKDARSPARQLHILGPEDLVAAILELREITDWNLPIIVKIGASNVYYDMKIILKSGADAGAVDGLSGGTGAAPVKVENVIGINTEPAIVEARSAINDYFLERIIDPKFRLLASGGIFDYEHIFKAIALGADGVALGTAFLLSADCTLVMTCNTNNCPAGITGSPDRFNISKSVTQIINYVLATAGKLEDIMKFSPTIDDLVTDANFVSAFSGIKLGSGCRYEDKAIAEARDVIDKFIAEGN